MSLRVSLKRNRMKGDTQTRTNEMANFLHVEIFVVQTKLQKNEEWKKNQFSSQFMYTNAKRKPSNKKNDRNTQRIDTK